MVYTNLSLCRICLQEGAMFPIFEKNEDGTHISTTLSSCLKEKVEDITGFPRHICDSCNTTLETLNKFINKYKESNKVLESGLLLVKTEVPDNLDSDNHFSDTEIKPIETIKTESDDELNLSLASLAKSVRGKEKKKNKETLKKKSVNQTNKIASSILEGKFAWNGEKWCMDIGEITLKRITRRNNKHRPKPQTKLKVPKASSEKQKEKPDIPEKLCDLCGEIFKDQDKLTLHKRKTHGRTPMKCPKCPRICVSEYYLSRHVKRRHDNVKDFVCANCGMGFAFKGELTRHTKIVHNKHLIPKKVFSCKFCNKTYKCAKSIVVHERSVHTGLRPAECTVCGSRFYHIDYLKEHMRLHTGETPFKCPICGRGYAQRSNMKSHLRTHRVSELDAVTLTKIKPEYIKLLKV